MNKTTNYQLNQWDPEDRILRVNFNADNTAIESALKENADAVSAEAAARSAADTSIRTDFAAADNTIKSSLNSEISTRQSEDTAIRTAFAAADATVEGKISRVKLLDTTTTSAATQINVSVSGLNLHTYSKIMIIPIIKFSASASDTVWMRLNNLSTSIYYMGNGSGNKTTMLTSFYPASGHSTSSMNGAAEINLYLAGTYISGHSICACDGTALDHRAIFMESSALAPSAITAINFLCKSGTSLAAGSRVIIYGVK